MVPPANQYLAPAIAIFAVLAVTFAGFGGLAATESHRNLFAAGASFWLLMLLVPWIFVSTRDWSQTTQSSVSVAHGGLAGLCVSLCFAPGAGWMALLAHLAAGAAIGFAIHWLLLIRYGTLWRDE